MDRSQIDVHGSGIAGVLVDSSQSLLEGFNFETVTSLIAVSLPLALKACSKASISRLRVSKISSISAQNSQSLLEGFNFETGLNPRRPWLDLPRSQSLLEGFNFETVCNFRSHGASTDLTLKACSKASISRRSELGHEESLGLASQSLLEGFNFETG